MKDKCVCVIIYYCNWEEEEGVHTTGLTKRMCLPEPTQTSPLMGSCTSAMISPRVSFSPDICRVDEIYKSDVKREN